MSDPESVLAYWFTPEPNTPEDAEQRKSFWFGGGKELDDEIRRRFGALVARARVGELDGWTETARGTLALIVLLDQFSRNLYRGTPDAFSCDNKALGLAREGYDSGRFAGFGTIEHMFASMPFRHAENVADQKRAVALAVHDALRCPAHLKDLLVYSVDWARKHLDVVVRFGRFPHRNVAMGRPSTPEELEYIEYLRFAGQWL